MSRRNKITVSIVIALIGALCLDLLGLNVTGVVLLAGGIISTIVKSCDWD